ncbi:MAG: hypothetical protein K2K57_10930 [Oscillospiraceae bacterium]|nr:hypothetical protein [Oscillospiraceae bacterium]
MNNTVLEHINELFDSYDLFSGTGIKKIYSSVKRKYPNMSEEEIEGIKDYLCEFYEYCMNFADIISDKYKTPFLPTGEEAQKEITEYVIECRKQYPEIDQEHICH